MGGTRGGDDVADRLLAYERALASRDASRIDVGLDALIPDDFLEFGASGRVWDAPAVRELLASLESSPVAMEDAEVTRLAEGVVLVTYRLGGPRPSNRSSVWLERGGRWVLRFHQGTPRP